MSLPLPPPLAVESHHLSNGLTVLVAEDHTHPVASVQIWCGSGSSHEAPNLGSGTAHFVEHMLFKGTQKRHYSQIASEIQSAGGSVNAYTTFDRTVYYVNGPSDGALQWLDVLGDMARNSAFPSTEFTKEQEVIRREFAMGFDDPQHILAEMTFATAFRSHPMRHPIIGHLDIFNALTRENLVEFHRSRYSSDNLFIVVSGDVKASTIFKKADTLFGTMKRVGENPPIIPDEPAACGRRELRRHIDSQIARLTLSWQVPGLGLPGHTALNMLADALGGGESSRLWSTLREDQSLADHIHASVYTPGPSGLFFIDAECSPDKTDPLITAIHDQVHKIAENGIQPDELEKIRRHAVVRNLRRMTTAAGQAGSVAISWHLAKHTNLSHENLTKILEIQAQDIQDAARNFLHNDALTITALGPENKKRTRKNSSTKKKKQIQRIELPGAFPLIMLPDDRIPMMQIHSSFKGGSLADPSGKAGITRLLTSVWAKGAGHRDSETLTREIENLGGSIDTDSGINSLSVSVTAFSFDSGVALDMMADILRQPHLTNHHTQREREAQLAELGEIDDNPMSVAMREMRVQLFHNHPLVHPVIGTPADLYSIGVDDIRHAAQRLLHPANGAIAVSGSFDPAEMQDGLARRLDGWKTGPSFLPPSPQPLKKGSITHLKHKKEQAIQVTAFQMPDLAHADRIPLALLNEACSDMSSRLFTRIREEMGLAYFVGANSIPGLTGGVFYFYLGTSPDKATEVNDVLQEEIASLATKGLTQTEIDRSKRTLLGKISTSRQKIGSQAFESLLDEIYGLGHLRHQNTTNLISTCPLDQIIDATQRLLTQPAVTVLLRPE